MTNKISLMFELALKYGRMVEAISTIAVEKEMMFKDAVKQVLETAAGTPANAKERDIEFFDVYVNRSPKTNFFLIGATQEQERHFEESKLNPPHEKIPETDLKLPVDEIIKKYKIGVFTIYRKE
ncbi:MAG: hypothetical protein ACTSUE_27395 [Promethearchaeota archaeon]